MSVRRDLIDLATPFPEGWSHDEWLSLVGAAAGRGVPTAPVMHYRQHGAQVVGAGVAGLEAVVIGARSKRLDHYAREAWRYRKALDRASHGSILTSHLLPHLRAKLAFLEARQAIHAGGAAALPAFARTLRYGDHARFSGGLRSMAKDLYLAARMTLARVRSVS